MGSAVPEAIDVRIGSRDAERVRVLASVDALCRNSTCLVLLLDLSITGARVETAQSRFCVGEVVRLRLPFLPTEKPGEIVWTNGRAAGVRFFESLDMPTFQILAKSIPSVSPDLGEGVDWTHLDAIQDGELTTLLQAGQMRDA